MALVEAAADRLWTPEGEQALAYLRGRGLTEATIRRPPRVDARGDDPNRGRSPLLASRRASSSLGSMATGWRWSRSASPRGGSRSTPKRSATARRSIRPLGRSPWQAAGDRGRGIRRPLARSRAGGAGRRRDPRVGIGPTRGIDLPGDAGRPCVVSSPPTPTKPGTRPPRGGRPERGESGRPPRSRIGPRSTKPGSTGFVTSGGGILIQPGTPWEELAAHRWGPDGGLTDAAADHHRPARPEAGFSPRLRRSPIEPKALNRRKNRRKSWESRKEDYLPLRKVLGRMVSHGDQDD